MDPNINPEGLPSSDSSDNYQSFSSHPPTWQDSTPRFRGQGQYSGIWHCMLIRILLI